MSDDLKDCIKKAEAYLANAKTLVLTEFPLGAITSLQVIIVFSGLYVDYFLIKISLQNAIRQLGRCSPCI